MISPRKVLWRKVLLILAGVFICFYALTILWYVQTVPDIGLQCAFTPVVNHVHPAHRDETGADQPQRGDRIVQVGETEINTWPQLLHSLRALKDRTDVPVNPESRSGLSHYRKDGTEWVLVKLERQGDGSTRTIWTWRQLGSAPVETLVPSVLWFLLKFGLFAVAALVFWQRPADRSAAHFFLLSIVTVGAYMGGYHWSRIAIQPGLVLVFMFCAVLLPPVILHFYLIFPRPKGFLREHPRRTLLAVYGVPVACLIVLLVSYAYSVWVARSGLHPAQAVVHALQLLLSEIFVCLGVAALWYLASVLCLVHSYATASDLTERNQVKWILIGSLGALAPIGYTLYLITWKSDDFGAGYATWPMFGASVCFTVAFVIGITRYRLMQLDQLISSGMGYFLISFLAGLLYYALVFVGTLVVGSQVIPNPSLSQVVWVSSSALVLMVLLDLVRSRLIKALDRRFYRDKYQLDKTLRRMGQTIEQLVDPPTLARRLLQASTELLNVGRGAVFLRDGTPPLYRLVGAIGHPPPLTELAPGCPLVDAVQARGAVTARPWPGQAADPVHAQLRFLGGEAAQALTHDGRLVALLVLGPKEMGPYSTDDLNLLAAFAQITTLALESAEGHRTIELLNRDLQDKVEKISEQQRRILALQSQLTRQAALRPLPAPAEKPEEDPALAKGGIVGSSPPVRQLLQFVKKVSASQSAVLIGGESGTGKELLARAIHENSPRAAKPFVKVHCAALSPGLLESELFGHVRGAFTGAIRDKVGRFELAHGGTLFLDEIGDITLDVQTKLLRVLQETTFERVGASEPVHVDVRIIAATHQVLPRLIEAGRFREDLFYRLNVISIQVPPLRERREDIVELAQHFLRAFGQRCGKQVSDIDDDALVLLKSYPWPGNIRELENVIERAVVVAERPILTVQELPEELVAAVAGESRLAWGNHDGTSASAPAVKNLRPEHEERAVRDQQERERLVRALASAAGNKAEAARALGVARSTLISRLKKYGLN